MTAAPWPHEFAPRDHALLPLSRAPGGTIASPILFAAGPVLSHDSVRHPTAFER